MENNDYKYLVISDNYDFTLKEDLSELWEDILHEYAELEGNNHVLDKFDAFREIHQLAVTYDIINTMIYSLYYQYNQSYINDLDMFGYKVQIVNNCITVDSLEKCSQMARSILNEIHDLKKVIEPEEKANAKNLFYKCMAWLIKGYGNLEDNITVAKYIALKNHLNKIIRDENGRNKRK
ncbi:MAG: hypothetical protein IID16_01075 [Candidatus Marinimicrobia bacterium]|nr:hypothetical protein [Candidatus Neomarinimicrobiota bacterium]